MLSKNVIAIFELTLFLIELPSYLIKKNKTSFVTYNCVEIPG